MKKSIKASLVVVGLTSLLGLTACQSTPQASQAKAQNVTKSERHFKGEGRHHFKGHNYRHHDFRGQRGELRRGPLTEEQKATFEKLRADRQAKFEALQKACEGKAGQDIAVKFGENTIEGTCQVNFKPKRAERPNPAKATAAAVTTAPKS